MRWSLTVVTPRHVLGLFHRMGVVFEDDTMAYKPLADKQVRPARLLRANHARHFHRHLPARSTLLPGHIHMQVLRFLRKYTDFFSDLCLQGYDFQQYAPTRLAAAIVVAARRCLILRPEWNPELRGVTRYTLEDLQPVLEHLWRHYVASYPAEAAVQEEQGRQADAKVRTDGAAMPRAGDDAASTSAMEGRGARLAAADAGAAAATARSAAPASTEASQQGTQVIQVVATPEDVACRVASKCESGGADNTPASSSTASRLFMSPAGVSAAM
jgi:hypothetical protein